MHAFSSERSWRGLGVPSHLSLQRNPNMVDELVYHVGHNRSVHDNLAVQHGVDHFSKREALSPGAWDCYEVL